MALDVLHRRRGRRAAPGRSPLRPTALVLLAGLTPLPPCRAQMVDVRVGLAHADQDLLSTMIGPTIVLGVPVGTKPISLRFGVERLEGSTDRTGVACGGLADPTRCPPEPIRDEASLTGGLIGLGVPLSRGPHLQVDLEADLFLERTRADTRGLDTGNRLAAHKITWGPVLDLGVAWAPWPAGHLTLEAGAGLGGEIPVTRDRLEDGYTPFEHGFVLTRLWLGLGWRWR